MEPQNTENATLLKLIHVKIMDGTEADVYEVGLAMKKLKELLPFKFEAIITNDKIEISDINNLIIELTKLKKKLVK